MAQKKGGGSTRNGRDSQPKMLGVKVFGGQVITAVRATEGDELLTPEAHAASAPVASGDVDGGFVDELHDGAIFTTKKPRRTGASGSQSSGFRPGSRTPSGGSTRP